MSVHIGRKQAVGIGFETTAGTKVSAEYWIPKTSGDMIPTFENAEDTSGYGVIDQNYDMQVVKEGASITLESIVGDETIGAMLLPVFGSASVSGSGDYTHTFTRDNTNNHQTVTVRQDDPVGAYSSAYAMVNTFSLDVAVGEYVRSTTELMGNKLVSESSPTVTYTTDNLFLAKHATVKFADTEAGLAGATAIDLESVNISIAKNLIDYQAIGSVDTDSRHNQSFAVAGSISALFDNETLLGYVRNSSKKFMQLTIVNTDVTLAGSGNPTLTLTLARCGFSNFTREGGNDDIIKQSMDFTAMYDTSGGFTAKATLLNERSTAYGA